MDTPTTTTDAALLRLIWLASPALPVGGFSCSEGLEAAVEAPLVADVNAVPLVDADRQVFTPMLAILSAPHETQYSRLFRS